MQFAFLCASRKWRAGEKAIERIEGERERAIEQSDRPLALCRTCKRINDRRIGASLSSARGISMWGRDSRMSTHLDEPCPARDATPPWRIRFHGFDTEAAYSVCRHVNNISRKCLQLYHRAQGTRTFAGPDERRIRRRLNMNTAWLNMRENIYTCVASNGAAVHHAFRKLVFRKTKWPTTLPAKMHTRNIYPARIYRALKRALHTPTSNFLIRTL